MRNFDTRVMFSRCIRRLLLFKILIKTYYVVCYEKYCLLAYRNFDLVFFCLKIKISKNIVF